MATIGYVDTTYADEYVAQHFLSTDEPRARWESLDEADKEVLLRRSFEALEALPWAGRKAKLDQPYAFPRIGYEEAPEAIMAAQVENAVSASDTSDSEEASLYEKMWRYGISSYTIGNLSETTGSGAWGGKSTNSLISSKASRLVQPYLQGGYKMRRCRP